MTSLLPELLQEGPFRRFECIIWEERMTGIVDLNREALRNQDALGNTPLVKCLLEPSLKYLHIEFLAKAEGKYFKWNSYSTYHFQYLKNTCSSAGILQSSKALGADLSLRDSNGDALLHFFGHNKTLQHEELPNSHRHDIFACRYLDSASDLKILLVKNGKLFDRNSQGITALSDILEKVQCHMGYVAFFLLC
jgi:hypothetical protein